MNNKDNLLFDDFNLYHMTKILEFEKMVIFVIFDLYHVTSVELEKTKRGERD